MPSPRNPQLSVLPASRDDRHQAEIHVLRPARRHAATLTGTGQLTVADALALPELRRGLPEVLAGAGELHRVVRWVHPGEVPDIASLLRGGELLLTTGMGIGPWPADQQRFVRELAGCGIAGLVIELGPTLPTVPEALVRAAGRESLPLVALHRKVAFVAVTEALHSHLVNAQVELLQFGNEIQRELTELLLEGKSIDEVLEALAGVAGNPVVLESRQRHLLHHAAPPGAPDDMADLIEVVHGTDDAIARAGGVVVGLSETRTVSDERLIMLPTRRPVDALARVALERGAGVIALGLLRTRQGDELRARERGNLLVAFAGEKLTPDAAARRAVDMGLPLVRDDEALLALAAVQATRPTADDWSLLLRDVERELRRANLAALVGAGVHPGELLSVVVVRPGTDWRDVAESAAVLLRSATQRRLGRDAVSIAVGRPSGWMDLSWQLRVARDVADAGTFLPSRNWHDARACEVDRLLWQRRADPELHAFARRALERLDDHDRRRSLKLTPTLEALCQSGGRRAATARLLHLNRQALYSRINRLERILGEDLSDGDTLLRLDLALRARRFVASPAAAGHGA